jgi:hypothetical protein
MDIRFQQRQAHFSHSRIDIGFAQLASPAQV